MKVIFIYIYILYITDGLPDKSNVQLTVNASWGWVKSLEVNSRFINCQLCPRPHDGTWITHTLTQHESHELIYSSVVKRAFHMRNLRWETDRGKRCFYYIMERLFKFLLVQSSYHMSSICFLVFLLRKQKTWQVKGPSYSRKCVFIFNLVVNLHDF